MTARVDGWVRTGLASVLVALLGIGLVWTRSAWKNVDRVWSLTFSPDGRFLAVQSDKAMTIYQPSGAGRLVSVTGGRDAAFTPDGHRAAVHAPGTVAVFELTNGRMVSRLDAPADWNTSITFSPDGRLLAILASQMNSLELRDVATGARLWRIRPHEETDYAVAFSPNGRLIATGGRGGNSEVRIWDAESAELVQVIAMSLRTYLQGVRFLDGGSSLMVDGINAVYDLRDLDQITENPQHPVTRFSGHVAPSADDRYAAGEESVSSVWSRSISIVDLTAGRTVLTTGAMHGLYWDAAFAPGGESVSVATSDGTVSVWDLASGRRTATYEGNRAARWSRRWLVLGGAGFAWLLAWIGAYAISARRPVALRTHRDWLLVPMSGAAASVGIVLLTWLQVLDPWRGPANPLSALQLLALGEAACLIPLVILSTATHSWRALAVVAALFPLLLLVTAGVWMDAVASV